MAKLGILQCLFLIKFCLSSFEKGGGAGHISEMIVSANEWDPSVLQLCVDLCQINAIDFVMPNWLDLIHSCECVDQGLFFSQTTRQQLFKIKSQLVPNLDPLSSYSLYQEWEQWFEKLYEFG